MSLVSLSQGRLLRITTFTSSGTWNKLNDVGYVVVEVVGGGGGGADFNSNAGNGGTSSFGSHVSATGGLGGVSIQGIRSGGSGVGGDLNISGRDSLYLESNARAGGGESFMGSIGLGGYGDYGTRGGGGGGYAKKLINSSSLNSSETVTVGTGGTRGAGGEYNVNGYSGIVIIYEYSL